MPLEAHIGPIRLQHACSAGLSEVPGCKHIITGLAIVSSNNIAAMPICENHAIGFILAFFKPQFW